MLHYLSRMSVVCFLLPDSQYISGSAPSQLTTLFTHRVFGTFKNTNDRETVYAWFTFSHWLIYANSAANPIIYNFLSGEFAAFSCLKWSTLDCCCS